MSNNINTFQAALKSAQRVLAVCGAGLSASSGLPTFRGAGGMWRNHDAIELATPEAFAENPGLVWQFYSVRRHMALEAKPNPAHYALAQAARVHPSFRTFTQNVDGLSGRAGHPEDTIRYLHGSLFAIKCDQYNVEGVECDYYDYPNVQDPFVEAFRMPEAVVKRIKEGREDAGEDEGWRDIPRSEIPKCPKCEEGLLRPGVVWFGEQLDAAMLDDIHEYLTDGVDLCIVVGTSGAVYPAAGYASLVRRMGGKVAIFDLNPDQMDPGSQNADWVFAGDAAKLLPELLRPLIGELVIPQE